MTREILVLAVLINALMLLVLAEVVFFVANQTEAPEVPIPAATEAQALEAPGLKAREVRP